VGGDWEALIDVDKKGAAQAQQRHSQGQGRGVCGQGGYGTKGALGVKVYQQLGSTWHYHLEAVQHHNSTAAQQW
jgi:hypothetical protein